MAISIFLDKSNIQYSLSDRMFLYRFGNFITIGRGAEQIFLKSVNSFHDDFALNITNVAINVNKKVDLFIT